METPIVAVIPESKGGNVDFEGFYRTLNKPYLKIEISSTERLFPNPRVAVLLIRAAGRSAEHILNTFKKFQVDFPNAQLIVDFGQSDNLGKEIKDKKVKGVYVSNDGTTIIKGVLNICEKFSPVPDPFFNQAD